MVFHWLTATGQNTTNTHKYHRSAEEAEEGPQPTCGVHTGLTSSSVEDAAVSHHQTHCTGHYDQTGHEGKGGQMHLREQTLGWTLSWQECGRQADESFTDVTELTVETSDLRQKLNFWLGVTSQVKYKQLPSSRNQGKLETVQAFFRVFFLS